MFPSNTLSVWAEKNGEKIFGKKCYRGIPEHLLTLNFDKNK